VAANSATRSVHRLAAFAALLLMPVCGGCGQHPWPLWDAYAARFIDQQGRVIDPQGGSHTTSEGQSYALFFALVDNDRARFDRILAWTQTNLAQGGLAAHLPSWLWGKDGDGQWKVLDPNSASDADTWLAYSLIEAGQLWKEPRYAALGLGLAHLISASEVADLPGFGPMLVPGPIGFEHNGSWTLNPSYLPVFIFQRLAAADPAGPWQRIAQGIPRLLRESSRKGYAMDWVSYAPNDGFLPAPQFPDKSAPPPVGSYDAIRVYLWAGMLDDQNGTRSEILDALPSMSAYLAYHDAPPEKVSDEGIPSDKDGIVGFSAAVMPYLRAIPGNGRAMIRQTVRMNALRDPQTGMYGKDLTYYDQNLALFGTGFMDRRFKFGPHGELKVGWTRS
jgi:endo-1,4-beta-D-glucanase Y